MSLSIAQVARMSGVTARTLRHYDQIGLLVPAFTGSSGRRHYEPDQLNRLQRILLLRELGLGLQPIAQALAAEANDPNDPNDPNGDGAAAATGRQVAALRRHLAWLHRERDRCTRLIGTVSATIDTLERGEQMSPESMFAGFEHNPYEAEARERWGDDVVEASAERLRSLGPDGAERARTGFDRVHEQLAVLRAQGLAPDDARVQALIADHHGTVSLFWTPDAPAYRGLAAMYVDDERFRRNIGRGDDALVEFLRDAMIVYADTRLG